VHSAYGGGGQNELPQLASFQQQVGRAMAILHIYAGFRVPAPVSALNTVWDNGSIPLLDWGCAPPTDVTSGQDDAVITAYADALKAWGHPVLLRWFWEMNIPASNKKCPIQNPAQYVAAWRHIWTIFHQQGVSNVSFVWCPGIGGGLDTFASYYPGDQYVDWIAVDGYLRRPRGPQPFSALFGAWYAQWASHAKPMMIGETGAQGALQAPYIENVAAVLPTRFPQIKAFVYFDAPGPAGPWQLSGDGLSAFTQMGASSYFSARP
jgi:hypothetical protein